MDSRPGEIGTFKVTNQGGQLTKIYRIPAPFAATSSSSKAAPTPTTALLLGNLTFPGIRAHSVDRSEYTYTQARRHTRRCVCESDKSYQTDYNSR
ncbi:MAG: hypothetical protein M5U34_40020 [Chloroflexi bacterium]|nr:hypothetical protein [Chloroflexota bacterium]